MANNDVRSLRLLEFNNALSHVSEIIAIKRKQKQLSEQKSELVDEKLDWEYDKNLTEEEKIAVNEIIDNIRIKIKDIKEERNKLEERKGTLKKIVTKIIEDTMDSRTLSLQKSEIQQDMLEEYAYILCEIKMYDSYMEVGDIFDEVADFVILLAQTYGEDMTPLIRDIINGDLEHFDDYFE